MQYDQPITGGELNDAINQNPGISEDAKQAIDDALGISTNPDAPINVASATFDPTTGELVITQPDGQAQALIIDLSQATGPQVLQLSQALSQAGVFIIDSDVDVTLTFNTVERVIISDNGNDFITVNGDKNTTIDGGNGNDTLATSGGNDSVLLSAGNDSISTGAGGDTVQAGNGSDTVNAGTGYDLLEMTGAKSSYSISVQNGALVVSGAGGAVATNSEYVAFADGSSLTVSGDPGVAAVMRLYEALLNRAAEFDGAHFWSNGVEGGVWSNITQTADFFLHSAEFQSIYGNPDDLSNQEFVNILYDNVLGRPADDDGANFWVEQLDSGAMSRPDITVFIAGSDEAKAYTSDTVKFIDGWV